MKIYFIEVGVLLDNTSELFEDYNMVYDHNYGYYDENQFFQKDFQKAKQYVEEYVEKGINLTYGLIKRYNLDYMPEEGIDYTVDNIILSIKKENNQLHYNFIDININKLYEAYKKDWCENHHIDINNIDENIGDNGEIYVCFDEFIKNEYQDYEYVNYLKEKYDI